MRLDRHREEAKILDPRSGFSEATSEVEVRIDPLTGARTRINITRSSRPKQSLAKVEGGSCAKCLFCPESVETVTPRFPPSFLREGRLKSGKAILFPNLFPLAGHHAVCVFTPEHKLEIAKITPQEVLDGLRCGLMFFSRSAELGVPHHFMGWNHLCAAGASILHPHFQLVTSKGPLAGPKALMEASERFFRREGKDYWSQLIQAEASSPRLIGETRGFTWLAPWAPFGAFEVLGVSDRPSLMEMQGDDLRGMAEGLTRILRGYANLGVTSVNMGVFSVPEGAGRDTFRASVRIMSRPGTGTSDRALLELYGEEIGLSTLPEDYAGSLREQF